MRGRNLPLAPQASAQARRLLDEFDEQIPRDVLNDLRVVTSELVSNAVRHSGTDTGQIELRITPLTTCVRVEIIDPGPGFFPAVYEPSARESGWGLYLVDRLTTRWGVEFNDGAHVWAEVPLKPDRS
jgi:anti-sigma regulatory factor (Ser/Thr protein kinase)